MDEKVINQSKKVSNEVFVVIKVRIGVLFQGVGIGGWGEKGQMEDYVFERESWQGLDNLRQYFENFLKIFKFNFLIVSFIYVS